MPLHSKLKLIFAYMKVLDQLGKCARNNWPRRQLLQPASLIAHQAVLGKVKLDKLVPKLPPVPNIVPHVEVLPRHGCDLSTEHWVSTPQPCHTALEDSHARSLLRSYQISRSVGLKTKVGTGLLVRGLSILKIATST